MDKIWCIAYINPKGLKRLDKDLKKRVLKGVEVFIPTLKTLKKTKNSELQYEERLMLFNYGFIRVPNKKLNTPGYMNILKDNITCIVGWVKNSCVDIKGTPYDIDNGLWERPYTTATASDLEVEALMVVAKNQSLHSKEDIESLKVGQIVLLHGYPFDGLYATVCKIDLKAKKVRAKVHLNEMYREQIVDFENILYSVYDSQELPDSRTRLDGLTLNLEM